MDTKKIGGFLKTLRKESHMTQEQLGERIGVTNKTVSRWETGNYMPPVDILLILSDIYKVSVNELLVGERINGSEFQKTADENVVTVLKETEEKQKKFERKMLILLIATTIIAIAIMILLPVGKDLTKEERIREFCVIVLVWVLAFISNTLNIMAIALGKVNAL